jgi:hypothetical protein
VDCVGETTVTNHTTGTRELCSRFAARLDELATGDSERASVARSYVETVWTEFGQRLERLVLAIETRFPEVRGKGGAREKPALAVNVERQGRLF